MARSKTNIFYVTATTKEGRSVSSYRPDGGGWCNSLRLDHESFLDPEGLMDALDHATEQGFSNVSVRGIYLGDEVSDDDLRELRFQEEAARRATEREALILEKGLTPEQVALISEPLTRGLASNLREMSIAGFFTQERLEAVTHKALASRARLVILNAAKRKNFATVGDLLSKSWTELFIRGEGQKTIGAITSALELAGVHPDQMRKLYR